MTERYDAVVIGMGPGGEVVADRLLDAGRRVAVVEKELIGGECAYWACIPSKTVLRGGEVLAESRRVAGAEGMSLSWDAMREYRDYMVRYLDDSAQIDGYERRGARVIKGEALLDGPGQVLVNGESLKADHIIVATGSDAYVPPIVGLEEMDQWTSREIFSARDLPASVAVVGGSAVGVETALFLCRYGTQVTLIQRSGRLLAREDPAVGDLARLHLEAAGARVRTGVTPRRCTPRRVELDDGSAIEADVIAFATGRTPRTGGLGLETGGAHIDDRGAIRVDDRCQAAPGLWAVGDVTGLMPFTHVAKYQARVVVDTILGRPRRAHYSGIPRVVFADPEIAAVGLTPAEAGARGIRTIATEVDVPAAIGRPWTYEREPRGRLGVLADSDADVLVGAWAVAPLAGEWIHYAALAIRAQVRIDVLLDQVAQFPTYVEAYLAALEALRKTT